MQILFWVFFAQLRFEWQEPVQLKIDQIDLSRIAISEKSLIIRDDAKATVHLLNRDGSYRLSLGQNGEIVVPGHVSYMAGSGKIYVYDGAKLVFTVWQEDGTFVEEKGGPYEMFFQVGRLLPFANGYIGSISPVDGVATLAHFDTNLKLTHRAYPAMNQEMAVLNPELARTYVTHVGEGRDLRVLAMQRFSQRVSVFDANLTFLNTMHVNNTGWKEVRSKKLEKVANNPQELEKLGETFSEIIALETINRDLFIVGIRNLSDPRSYHYQMYNAETGMPEGSAVDSPYLLVGSFQGSLWFCDPVLNSMTLFRCQLTDTNGRALFSGTSGR